MYILKAELFETLTINSSPQSPIISPLKFGVDFEPLFEDVPVAANNLPDGNLSTIVPFDNSLAKSPSQ